MCVCVCMQVVLVRVLVCVFPTVPYVILIYCLSPASAVSPSMQKNTHHFLLALPHSVKLFQGPEVGGAPLKLPRELGNGGLQLPGAQNKG